MQDILIKFRDFYDIFYTVSLKTLKEKCGSR